MARLARSREAQAPAGVAHLLEIVKVLEHFEFESSKVRRSCGRNRLECAD